MTNVFIHNKHNDYNKTKQCELKQSKSICINACKVKSNDIKHHMQIINKIYQNSQRFEPYRKVYNSK